MGGLLGSSPAALGLDSPAGLGLGSLAGLGGVDMGISVSQMGSLGLGGLASGGMSQGAGVRMVDDEERRKRLEAVIRLVGQRPGRVSDEGIERLARRYGLDVQCEPPVGQNKADGVRQITLAGETLLIDLTSKDDVVQSIQVEGPDAFSGSAAALLKSNLTVPEGAGRINYTLDKFAKNLERIARLDKLEGANFNCYEAISGVYTSLKKLYDHEKKAAVALLGDGSDEASQDDIRKRELKADREVMCRKSGRPRLNARGRIGLTLDYWMDGRFISDASAPANAKETGGNPESSVANDEEEDNDGIYSLIIDCDSPATPYDAIRISKSWLSDTVEKVEAVPDDLFGAQQSIIDWQDPPESYLASPNEPQPDPTAEHVGKLPDIKFVARLDPPLPLPATVALLIKQLMLQAKIDPNPQEHEGWKHYSYDGLVLRPDKLDEAAEWKEMNNSPVDYLRQTDNQTEVLIRGNRGAEAERIHNVTLWSKPERGKVLEEVSFSHPRQIVELLPTLRQYAFLNRLLRRSFVSLPTDTSAPAINGSLAASLPSLPVDVRLKTSLEAANNPRIEMTFPLPSTPLSSTEDDAPKASVAAHTTPVKTTKRLVPYSSSSSNGLSSSSPAGGASIPTLDDLLSGSLDGNVKGQDMLHLTLMIEPNGNVKIEAGEQNIVPLLPPAKSTDKRETEKKAAEGEGETNGDGDDDAMEGLTKEITKQQEAEEKGLARVQQLGRALGVCEDLGVWIEWVGKQARKAKEDTS